MRVSVGWIVITTEVSAVAFTPVCEIICEIIHGSFESFIQDHE